MAQKTGRRVVALSTAAVTAIYMAGYLATSGVASASIPVVPTTGVAAASAGQAVARPAPATSTAARATATGAYKDGTYTGSGTSRRGGFDVAVTIQGGRVTNVALTRVTTQYPASRIAALPGQVVARQSAQVDRVSGATYSVQAFQQAVQQALAAAAT